MPLNLLSHGSRPATYEFDTVEAHVESPKGKAATVAMWEHGKSVSAAYWDPRGRSIVSTSYDDKLRGKRSLQF